MLFVKATYNGETRRFTTDDVFPSYQALCDHVSDGDFIFDCALSSPLLTTRFSLFLLLQIHKVFKNSSAFFLSDVTFTQSDGDVSLIANRISSADDWTNIAAAPFIGQAYPGGSLKFLVQDVLEHRRPRNRLMFDMDVDVDQTRAEGSAAPQRLGGSQSNRNSIISNGSTGSCCSVATAKSDIKGMMDTFLKDFQKSMSENFGDVTMEDTDVNAVTVPSRERTPVQLNRSLPSEPRIPGAFNTNAEAPNPVSEDAVHSGVVCDHCNKTVKGIRYKVRDPSSLFCMRITDTFSQCLTCRDFDLCQGCMGENNHGGVVHSAHYDAEHRFHSIAAPQGRRSFIEALAASRSRRREAAATRARPTEGQNAVHNAYCDVCDKTIVGSRHKCLDCLGE